MYTWCLNLKYSGWYLLQWGTDDDTIKWMPLMHSIQFIKYWTLPFSSLLDIMLMWCLDGGAWLWLMPCVLQNQGSFCYLIWRYTTLRLASCSFRALSSSLLARTASSVFFLLRRLTFSSVSGALLFLWKHTGNNYHHQTSPAATKDNTTVPNKSTNSY